eukprot:1128678-Prymnesium_polylepis.1
MVALLRAALATLDDANANVVRFQDPNPLNRNNSACRSDDWADLLRTVRRRVSKGEGQAKQGSTSDKQGTAQQGPTICSGSLPLQSPSSLEGN